MSKRSPKSLEEKLEVVLRYQKGERTAGQLAREYGISDDTVIDWMMKYQTNGIEGLKESHTWKKYSSDLKKSAVEDYLDGKGSTNTICQKYGISSTYVLRSWIKRYTSGKELTATSKGGTRMRQGRKTTLEERVEIVNFTIAHKKDYRSAMEKYGVSYQQVYSWVKKFDKQGSQGLVDRRGKGLDSKPNLTTEEELQLKIKQLEERNRYLEAEVGLLKKLEEIKHRNRR